MMLTRIQYEKKFIERKTFQQKIIKEIHPALKL